MTPMPNTIRHDFRFVISSAVASAVLAVLFAVLLPAPARAAQEARLLRVSADGKRLEYADGAPFFWLGDTAWQLFHRLDREEAEYYLATRARQGFTVIQAVALAELGGLTTPNANGDLPLVDQDPARPNEAYFRHIDDIVAIAARHGLFIGMLPAWGSYWKSAGRNTPPVFNPENARQYGRFLGRRYRDAPVIWILGGDQNIETPQERGVIDAMAAGLREGDGGTHLITFHPRGPGQSSRYVHTAGWLDFNMFQSSHGSRDHDNGLFAERDYALQPPKPTVDGEPRYEGIVVGFYFGTSSPAVRFDDYDARQAAYWSVLAGACGHTYGHNSVWQMWQPGRKPVIGANIPWREALDNPGAFQMGHLRRLFESRPFARLEPYQRMIAGGPATGGAKIRCARARDGSFAFIYSPRGEPFTADLTAIDAPRVKQIWFDPRYGTAYPIHTGDNHGFQTFTPPTSGRGCDWILILEDAAAEFPLPDAPR